MKIIFQSILCLIVGFIAFETFLQLTEIASPTLTVFDEDLGLQYRKNLKYLRFNEGFYMGDSNKDRRFGDDYTKEKPAGKIRIGLVGDSYVAGLDVLERHHFGRVLEEQLNEEEDKYQVLGFGRGNFSLPSTSYYLQNYAMQFDLDYVFCFLESRDFDGYISNAYVSRYELKNGELIENKEWKNSKIYNFLNFLEEKPIIREYKNISMINQAYRFISGSLINNPGKTFFGKFARPNELFFPWRKFSDKKEGFWEGDISEEKEMSEQSKVMINDLLKEGLPKIIFVTRNYPIKIEGLEAYLDSKKIDYVSLSELFDGALLRGTKINCNLFKATKMYGGHYNQHGHNALGKFLAKKFKDRVKN